MTVELPSDFITLATRELADPAALALQVLRAYVLQQAWLDHTENPCAGVIVSEK